MSYPYRVVVTKSVEEVVDAKDRVVAKVTLTPILPPEAMREVLRDVLLGRGWTESEPGKLSRKNENDEEQEFDLQALTVTTQLETKATIKKEKTVELVGDAWRKEDIDTQKERLREKAGKDLEKRLAVTDDERARKRETLEKDLAERLEKGDSGRKKDLNEALLQVYAEALKKKAASLGNVTSVREERRDGGREYELTIKVAE
jgi:FtsH ternary system domain X5